MSLQERLAQKWGAAKFMKINEFAEHVEILQHRPFSLWPEPEGIAVNRFEYVDDSPTHVRLKNVETGKVYQLSLTLVQFANDGVLRLTRKVEVFNGGFV
jgi:hypothetical protein